MIFFIINIFLLFVGCFLEPVSAMIILIPVFIPLCVKMDINMIHFGVLMVLNLMIGLLTPPVGLVLYVVSDVAKVPFERLVRSTFPFLLPLLISLAIVTYFEDVCLWLPRLMGLA
jgi:TRAP-type C4-dicarboxylate transport system permease large subunit